MMYFRPPNDNRASLLSRSPALPRKPEKERDGYMQVSMHMLSAVELRYSISYNISKPGILTQSLP